MTNDKTPGNQQLNQFKTEDAKQVNIVKLVTSNEHKQRTSTEYQHNLYVDLLEYHYLFVDKRA